MIRRCTLGVFLSTALLGCAATPSVYYPDLSQRAAAGDPNALRSALILVETTPPGERLEDLAQISSRFVRKDPETYLRVQSEFSSCYGVNFLGSDFVDDEPARLREIRLRREALETVTISALQPTRQVCLALLR